MSRFNTTSKGKNKTTNHVGASAFKQTAELELISILLTSFVQDSYYEKSKDQMNRLSDILKKVDPQFAAKAAIYARHEFGMRSISHVLSVEIMKYASGQKWGKNFFREVVRRPDDMTEIVSGLEIGDMVVSEGSFIIKSELSKAELGGGHGH